MFTVVFHFPADIANGFPAESVDDATFPTMGQAERAAQLWTEILDTFPAGTTVEVRQDSK